MKFFSRALVSLLALLLLAEEWLWDSLKRAVKRLAVHLHLQRLEALLRRLPPAASLFVLLLPALLMLPFKLAALWALGHGHALLGLAVFVAAKLCGTALAAYLFDLVRDSARQMPWFDRLYTATMALLARARAWLAAQPAYQAARLQLQQWRAHWAGRPALWRRWWRSKRRDRDSH